MGTFLLSKFLTWNELRINKPLFEYGKPKRNKKKGQYGLEYTSVNIIILLFSQLHSLSVLLLSTHMRIILSKFCFVLFLTILISLSICLTVSTNLLTYEDRIVKRLIDLFFESFLHLVLIDSCWNWIYYTYLETYVVDFLYLRKVPVCNVIVRP